MFARRKFGGADALEQPADNLLIELATRYRFDDRHWASDVCPLPQRVGMALIFTLV
jgi:hypothetical protein